MDGCNSYRQFSRRELMKVSTFSLATLLGLRVRDLVAFAGTDKPQKAKSVILLWMSGGMSHIDTLDPKPGTDVQGDFNPINTSVDGIQIGEVLPLTAKQMQHAAIIRSLTNREGEHGRATYQLLTSYEPTQQLVHPSIGAVAAHELEAGGDMPAFVAVGGLGNALSAGYLGQNCEAYYVGKPGAPDPFLKLPEGITNMRAKRRLEYLKNLNGPKRKTNPDDRLHAIDTSYIAAERFLESDALKAFDVDKEKLEVRERYGDNDFGRGCLLARRLVENGVRFVQVNLGGFDTHNNNFPRMRQLGSVIDAGMASLIEDLANTKQLDDTMVVLLSEFGRTPRINRNAGRDHHPGVFSCLMAGGGIKAGQVIGESDKEARLPKNDPVQVPDIHATICTALGINPDKKVDTPLDRPMKLVDEGEPIEGLI